MKRLFFGASLLFLAGYARSQNGLENIVVEKYYISDANDAASATNPVPLGSTTYRIYADMLPGYKFQAAFGTPTHALTMTTSTTFWNNDAATAATPSVSKTNLKNNTTMLDSWLSVGGTTSATGASGWYGILKSDDNGVATVVNNESPKVVQSTNAAAGIPVKTQDGLISTTSANPVQAVTFVGFTTETDVFLDGSANGSSFTTTNGAWSSLSGSTGPDGNNRVLIAQITTDGVFHYELNIQIGTPTGGTEKYVFSNPTGSEISIASLQGTLGASNVLPTVSITTPLTGSNFVTGDVVAIAANAADADGTVSQVEFFVDGVSLSVDATSPYNANYTSTAGSHALTAVATDNSGGTKTSATVTINAANNVAPSVSISSPSNGAGFVVGDVVSIAAAASDIDGTVASVEFFVDGVSIGIDATSPFTGSYTSVLGTHSLTAKATDNKGAFTTSAVVSINVLSNVPPSVSVTAPVNGSSVTAPAVVAISANASDADGSVTQVEFLVNGVSVGIDATSPYSVNWTSVIGTANITAKATDNKGAITTSSVVSLTVADPNALPYKAGTIVNKCLDGSFTLPISAVDSVKNIIGYDVVLVYDKTKVSPFATGAIVVNSALITASWVDAIYSVDAANGVMNISLFFNSSAPATANFKGKGSIFGVQFNKTAGFGDVDQATFTVSSLNESYNSGVTSKFVEPGVYKTYRDTVFPGSLKYWGNNAAIVYNSANPNDHLITNIYGNNLSCGAKSVAAVQPNTTGNFVYNINNGLAVNIDRNIAGTTSLQFVALSGADAQLVQRVLINDATLNPSVYQIIAMDVNLDGKVSAGDLSQINQRTVNMIPEFKQAWNYSNAGVSNGSPSRDWLFVNPALLTGAGFTKSTTYPADNGTGYSKARVPAIPTCLAVPVTNAASCPSIASDVFTGIMLGDVDGSYDPSALNANLKLAASNDDVIFDLSKATVSGNYIDVPVSVSSTKDVTSMDFALQFNEGNLVFNTILDKTTYMQSLSYYNTDDKTVRFTSSSLQNFETNKSIVTVRFSSVSGAISASDLSGLQALVNGKGANVKVIGGSTLGITSITNDSRMVNVYPNPASGTLYVEAVEKSTIQLFDMSGKHVIFEIAVNANQKQEINTTTIANGVYMMKVYNNNFVTMKKVVINN